MNQVSVIRTRFPMPQGMDGFDDRKWRILCETTFPSAKTPEAIAMAVDYCRARGLDVFKRPVHIVPMWNSALRREVETIWPGINEIQTTAARTKQWAGMDEPKWGPDTERTFKGRKKEDNKWEDVAVTVTFPEWCAVTVYRMIEGQRCAFTEPVFWLEAYSRMFGGEVPTTMWAKRPRGQLQKVAKAAALRAAFPEEGEYTAEEMEGKEIDAGGVVIEHEPARMSAYKAKGLGKQPIEPIWEQFMQEIGECETALAVENRAKYYRDKEFPHWPKGWPENAEEIIVDKLASFSTGEDLEQTLRDSVDTETGEITSAPQTRAEYIRSWHDEIGIANDATALLKAWNADAPARRRFSMKQSEVDDLKARLTTRVDELKAAPHGRDVSGRPLQVTEAG